MSDRLQPQDNAAKRHDPISDAVENVKKVVHDTLHIDIVHELKNAAKGADEANKQNQKQAARFLPGLEIH